MSPLDAAGVTLLLVLGSVLWALHAEAVDLGGRAAVLDDATAQAAVAARELAWHGRLATPYTLPLGLALHAAPPWPLAGVAPGMVLFGALVLGLAPAQALLARPEPRAGLTLVLPFCCYLLLGGCA